MLAPLVGTTLTPNLHDQGGLCYTPYFRKGAVAVAVATDPQTGKQIFVKLVELWSVRDVARLWKISPKTIYAHVKRGLIPYVCIGRRKMLVEAHLLALLEQNVYIPPSLRGKIRK